MKPWDGGRPKTRRVILGEKAVATRGLSLRYATEQIRSSTDWCCHDDTRNPNPRSGFHAGQAGHHSELDSHQTTLRRRQANLRQHQQDRPRTQEGLRQTGQVRQTQPSKQERRRCRRFGGRRTAPT
ncbi:hypothetical protein BTO20_32935 [Mycobacterium dioxanotrophicus]|uniref:Uncharacterized protein n=1 Tax=Mycobacterium dioxanotrophicus TaxID=482462 RepID=A0A1Y0CBT2_9MYCO|nr:hypothetical protein BTO20_32935 [Mycobacterium dioxanotrophicus]